MEDNIQFRAGTSEEFKALVDAGTVDQSTLYFLLDTHQIMKGSLLFASGLLENLEQKEAIEIYGGSATDVM